MTSEEARIKLRGILTEATEFENSVCYLTEEDAELLRMAIEALEQEQKVGRWILSGGYWRCSECKEKALLKLDKSKGGCREYIQIKSNACPNCGAKMESEGKEND